MKSITEYFLIPSFFIGVYSFYNINKLFNKNKQLENDIETILKTHLNYMEKQEKQENDMNDVYDMFEGIACSLPFTNKHEWQNKMLQRKLKRVSDRWLEEDYLKKKEEEAFVKKLQDEQQEERRKMKTQAQLDKINNKWKDEQTKFYDDEFVMPDQT
jgi:hypothetical protein